MASRSLLRARARRAVALLAALTATVAVAACGSSDDGGSSTSSNTSASGSDGGVATVKMGVVPAATFAPVFVGLEQGIFERHGIDLQIEVGGLAPTVFPRILKNQIQLGANTWGTLVTAREQNLPLTGIGPVDRGGETADDDYQGIIAKPGGVRSLEELNGKTVAVPTLKSFTDAQVRSVLKEAGVDISSVRFIAIPFPDIPAALKAGRVDAAGVVEPFFSQAKAEGSTPLASLSRGQLMGSIVAAEKWVEDEPDTVRRFQEAWAETLRYATDNPDAVRAALTRGLRIPEAVASRMTLPIWVDEIDEARVQEISDMMLDVDTISGEIAASDMITPFPLPAS
ncbi:ABC transporter substrate-binding protein [Conexibacter arvalis]|uniref:NitT/TauT family transport system substrate-binding protein n=1 Tax=Conexibacter arvalis TaxID=912552 RepID=A0A840IBZ2_9ACTN|nr:ABC transporter substrate-binding protein [Conexibacter arvalis]MBB4661845.1 NitT/TauT family transport system substrate-binding protein [Conexibacter arvalis]